MAVIDTSVVQILPDFSRFRREYKPALARASAGADVQAKVGVDHASLGRATATIARAGATMAKSLAIGVAITGVAVGKGLAETVSSASDLNETISRTGVLFGKNVGEIDKFASGAASSLGQSKKEALEAANSFAVYGKAAKISDKKLVPFTENLTKLASDMASASNTSPADAIDAIGSAMRGEMDPIEKYGVLLNEANLKATALKMGLIKTTKEALTPQQRVLAVNAALFEQLGDKGSKTMGDFERTSGALANQQRKLKASFENVKAEIGTGLLPVATKFVGVLNEKVLPAFLELWRKHGPKVVDFLTKAADKLGDFATKLADGTFAKEFRKWRDDLAPAMQKFSDIAMPIFDKLKEVDYDKLSKTVGTFLTNVADGLGKVAKWADENPKSAATIAGVLGAYAALNSGTGGDAATAVGGGGGGGDSLISKVSTMLHRRKLETLLGTIATNTGVGKSLMQNVSLNGTLQGETMLNPLWVTLTLPSKTKIPVSVSSGVSVSKVSGVVSVALTTASIGSLVSAFRPPAAAPADSAGNQGLKAWELWHSPSGGSTAAQDWLRNAPPNAPPGYKPGDLDFGANKDTPNWGSELADNVRKLGQLLGVGGGGVRPGAPAPGVPAAPPRLPVPVAAFGAAFLGGLGSPKVASQLDTFNTLNKSIQSHTLAVRKDDAQSADSSRVVGEYVASRKADVEAQKARVTALQGGTVAEQYATLETEKSRQTLADLLIQQGWSTTAADTYAQKVYGVRDANAIQQASDAQSRDSLAKNLTQMGYNRDEADKLAKQITDIPKTSATTITLPGSPEAKARLAELNTAINTLEGLKTTTLSMVDKNNVASRLTGLLAQQYVLSHPDVSMTEAENRMRKQQAIDKYAAGGKVRGFSPNARADNIPAMLTADEFVQPRAAVKKYGVGFMEAIRTLRLPAMFADGGLATWPFNVDISKAVVPAAMDAGGEWAGGLSADARIRSMQQWALAQRGKRYLWAAVGPNNYDCSGLVGNLYALATGRPLYRRYMSTGDMGPGRHGMVSGPGKFTIYLGPGHTAANVGGLHAEAYGGNGTPNAIGHIGTRLSYYYARLHLPGFAGGGRIDPTLLKSPADRLAAFRAYGWPEPPPTGAVAPRAQLYDNGGVLAPGATLAVNNTGRNEYVSKDRPGGPVRLDGRDLAALATLIAKAVSTQTVTMDGRRVAEVTHSYDYLAGGL